MDAGAAGTTGTDGTAGTAGTTGTEAAPAIPGAARHIASPQGTATIHEVDPDYTNTRTPWQTTLYITRNGGAKGVLVAEFLDHGNTFQASWINEKLLFVQVWWGRIASSDLIIDVDGGKLLYHEVAHYGALSEPCL